VSGQDHRHTFWDSSTNQVTGRRSSAIMKQPMHTLPSAHFRNSDQQGKNLGVVGQFLLPRLKPQQRLLKSPVLPGSP
jgi:hypothetical protein